VWEGQGDTIRLGTRGQNRVAEGNKAQCGFQGGGEEGREGTVQFQGQKASIRAGLKKTAILFRPPNSKDHDSKKRKEKKYGLTRVRGEKGGKRVSEAKEKEKGP